MGEGGRSSWFLSGTHASHAGTGTGLKQDYNPCSTGLLFCVNGEIRLPAFQILLVLFVELKPICLFLLTFELGLAPGFFCTLTSSRSNWVIWGGGGVTLLFSRSITCLNCIRN